MFMCLFIDVFWQGGKPQCDATYVVFVVYVACLCTPGLHNKIPTYNIFARGCVAQESFFYTINAKIVQGLGPKRRESRNGDRG